MAWSVSCSIIGITDNSPPSKSLNWLSIVEHDSLFLGAAVQVLLVRALALVGRMNQVQTQVYEITQEHELASLSTPDCNYAETFETIHWK